MNAAQRAAVWAKISELLAEHERAQDDAVRMAIAKSWEDLRTRLQVVALEEPANGSEVG